MSLHASLNHGQRILTFYWNSMTLLTVQAVHWLALWLTVTDWSMFYHPFCLLCCIKAVKKLYYTRAEPSTRNTTWPLMFIQIMNQQFHLPVSCITILDYNKSLVHNETFYFLFWCLTLFQIRYKKLVNFDKQIKIGWVLSRLPCFLIFVFKIITYFSNHF